VLLYTCVGYHRLREFSIDFDEASYGHALVEIETLCTSSNTVAAAQTAVDTLAAQLHLDVSSSGSIRGKVAEYLVRFRPERVAILQAAKEQHQGDSV
jgi:hypothetical protein